MSTNQYSYEDVIHNFNEGQKVGFARGLVIGAAAGFALAFFIAYRQYGPPSQVPNLSLLIGDIRRIQDDSEGIAYSICSRWRTHIVSDAQCREGADRYHDLASRFNGISSSLEAMLSTGHDDATVEAVRLNLSEAQRKYEDFRSWFNALPRELPREIQAPPNQPTGRIVIGALPELVDPLVDLGKHFFDGMKEMDKIKREHLISMIKELKFKPWSELSKR